MKNLWILIIQTKVYSPCTRVFITLLNHENYFHRFWALKKIKKNNKKVLKTEQLNCYDRCKGFFGKNPFWNVRSGDRVLLGELTIIYKITAILGYLKIRQFWHVKHFVLLSYGFYEIVNSSAVSNQVIQTSLIYEYSFKENNQIRSKENNKIFWSPVYQYFDIS